VQRLGESRDRLESIGRFFFKCSGDRANDKFFLKRSRFA